MSCQPGPDGRVVGTRVLEKRFHWPAPCRHVSLPAVCHHVSSNFQACPRGISRVVFGNLKVAIHQESFARIVYNPGMDHHRGNEQFETTHWSLVVSSREDDSTVRRDSLGELYQAYWYPLFAFLRRKGHPPEQAADYVQSFFVELIDKDFLKAVSPEKGHFRWFLMSAVQRYISKQVEKRSAQKRGGNRRILSLNINDAEQRYRLEPVDGWSAEKLYDRRWALAVLEQALERLRNEQERKGKLELYLALQPTLSGVAMTLEQYTEIGDQFGMLAGAVKVAALRLRQKYRDTIREIVAQTVVQTEDISDELDKLLSALRG